MAKVAKVAKIAKGVGLATLLFTHDGLGALYLVGALMPIKLRHAGVGIPPPRRVGPVEK